MKVEQINLVIAVAMQNKKVDVMAGSIKAQLHKLLSELDEVHATEKDKVLLNDVAGLLAIIQSKCTAYQTEKEVIKYLDEQSKQYTT